MARGRCGGSTPIILWCVCVCVAGWLAVCLSVCLPVCLSVCLFVCMSVCLSVWLSVNASFNSHLHTHRAFMFWSIFPQFSGYKHVFSTFHVLLFVSRLALIGWMYHAGTHCHRQWWSVCMCLECNRSKTVGGAKVHNSSEVMVNMCAAVIPAWQQSRFDWLYREDVTLTRTQTLFSFRTIHLFTFSHTCAQVRGILSRWTVDCCRNDEWRIQNPQCWLVCVLKDRFSCLFSLVTFFYLTDWTPCWRSVTASPPHRSYRILHYTFRDCCGAFCLHLFNLVDR